MDELKESVEVAINLALDKAESIWDQTSDAMNEDFTAKMQASNIPGHNKVSDDIPVVGNFVCMVLDVINSSNHLIESISPKKSKITGLQRIFSEVSGLNALGEIVISSYNGGITEFLGDGFLAFFNSQNDNSEENNESIYQFLRASRFILNDGMPILNNVLKERYEVENGGFPDLKVRIGGAKSKAIVTTMGFGKNKYPKAFGRCVWEASKLASLGDGKSIYISESLKLAWPSSKDGNLIFNPISYCTKLKGYMIDSKPPTTP